MKRVYVLVMLAAALAVSTPAGAQTWTGNTYLSDPIKANVNGGTDAGGGSYTSVKPSSGPWTTTIAMNASTGPISVWAANNIQFSNTVQPNNYGGASSQIVFKINLSEAITTVTWDMPSIYFITSIHDPVNVQFSVDGTHFVTCYNPPGHTSSSQVSGYADPAPITFTVPATTQLYLAFTGTRSWWYADYAMSSLGTLTFASGGTAPDWSGVAYDNTATTKNNINGGADIGGGCYTSYKPASGAWTETYSLAGNQPVNVWSANNITFAATAASPTGSGNRNSRMVYKVNLSEAITTVTWDLPNMYFITSFHDPVSIQYSVDGVHFVTCYNPPGVTWLSASTYTAGYANPSPITFTVPATTQLYLAFTGVRTWWYANYVPTSLGTLTFASGGTAPDWNSVAYDTGTTKNNINGGADIGGGCYTSFKPSSGAWTETYSVAGNQPVNVWAADNITFQATSAVPTGLGNRPSRLVFKVNLSETVNTVTWDLPNMYFITDINDVVSVQYSADGVNFATCYNPPGTTSATQVAGYVDPAPVTFTVPATTQLYLAFVGAQTRSYADYAPPSLGTLTFVPGTATNYTSVSFNPNGGVFTAPTSVTITSVPANAEIHYTTDGSIPTQSSPSYTSAVLVDRNVTLKAKAWASGYLTGDVGTASYTLVTNQASIPQSTLALDSDLVDWPATSQWSYPFVPWSGILTSTTKAKFAWSDAQDMLYVAVQTNQDNGTVHGGHLVIGISKDNSSVPCSGIGSTQLAFDPVAGGNTMNVMNEITYYTTTYPTLGWDNATTDGVAGKYSFDNATGIYSYEIAIPLWADWRAGQPKVKQTLSAGDVVYVYVVMQDALGTSNGTDLSYLGHASYANTALWQSAGATLTLQSYSYTAADLAAVLAALDSVTDGPGWNANVDFDGDGEVTSGDLAIVLANMQ